MAARYVGVQWNRFKLAYDLFVIAFMALFLVVFVVVTAQFQPVGASFHPVQLAIRASGALAFTMLTAILLIGPLARLTPSALPLLYNRRHFGVLTFLVLLVHAGLVTVWYHGFSDLNPLVSLFVSNPRYDSLTGYPFEVLGIGAFVILFLMAATSHDFWNRHLGPVWWKSLHMGVYTAYALIVGHIALGVMQSEPHPVVQGLLFTSIGLVGLAHIASHFRRPRNLIAPGETASLGRDWLEVGPVDELEEARARIVQRDIGQPIAVFRYKGAVQGVSHLCPHQGGPIGEGRVVDGCITCPWHGFQFALMDGRAPEPHDDQIKTYQTRIESGIVYVARQAAPLNKPASPSLIPDLLSIKGTLR
jgi:methionine sulfoxide reductase heme-binding subunit